jgi:hypothetical protein
MARKLVEAPGRPQIKREIEQLIVRMARKNRDWGYDRIVGALANLGYKVCDQTVGNVLQHHGLPPAPERKRTTPWSAFIRIHLALLVGTVRGTPAVYGHPRHSLVTRRDRPTMVRAAPICRSERSATSNILRSEHTGTGDVSRVGSRVPAGRESGRTLWCQGAPTRTCCGVTQGVKLRGQCRWLCQPRGGARLAVKRFA